MTTKEWRQDKDSKKDFGKMSVEKQKEVSKKHLVSEEQDGPSNEELAQKAAEKLDDKRAHPEHFDDYSGTM